MLCISNTQHNIAMPLRIRQISAIAFQATRPRSSSDPTQASSLWFLTFNLALSHVQADKDDAEAEVECKCQLLLALAEVTLDGSTPIICTPLFANLFCQAASGAVPIGPQSKVG